MALVVEGSSNARIAALKSLINEVNQVQPPEPLSAACEVSCQNGSGAASLADYQNTACVHRGVEMRVGSELQDSWRRRVNDCNQYKSPDQNASKLMKLRQDAMQSMKGAVECLGETHLSPPHKPEPAEQEDAQQLSWQEQLLSQLKCTENSSAYEPEPKQVGAIFGADPEQVQQGALYERVLNKMPVGALDVMMNY